MNSTDSKVLKEMSFVAPRAYGLGIQHNYFEAMQFDPREMPEAEYLGAMAQVRAGPKDRLSGKAPKRRKLIRGRKLRDSFIYMAYHRK